MQTGIARTSSRPWKFHFHSRDKKKSYILGQSYIFLVLYTLAYTINCVANRQFCPEAVVHGLTQIWIHILHGAHKEKFNSGNMNECNSVAYAKLMGYVCLKSE